jgi:hypothetical protein
LSISSRPQRTTIDAVLELFPSTFDGSFEAPTVAVLGSVPQSAASVRPLIWISIDAPAARFANEQLRAPAAIEQPGTGGLIAQFTPEGNVSFTVTFVAFPLPMLLTTIVNAAVWPAPIGLLSAVLTTLTSGHCTTTEACAGGGATPLPTVAVAVFGIVAQLAAVVVATM